MQNHHLLIFLFKIIPTSLLSRIFGLICMIPLPSFIITRFIQWYSAKFNIKNEYNEPSGGFPTINQFFTRTLKPGIHIINQSKNAVVSPVDARIDQYGTIDDNAIIQAKGISYSLNDLIPSKTADRFRNGTFMTLYLSPGDYHRIHSPVNGTITGYFNIPGKLYSVHEFMVKGIKNLFCLNERLITYIETPKGMAAVCKIGAMNVGKITLSFETVCTNKTFRKKNEFFYSSAFMPSINAGDELGRFNLGSTIVLIFEKGMVDFLPFKSATAIRMGTKIGTLKK